MQRVPVFDAEHLASIAKILADTTEGLTGSQIEHLLSQCGIPDPTPALTKWKRLYNALVELQNERQFGNHVIVFINHVMNPVQYTFDPQSFRRRSDQLNAVLSFAGFHIGDDGKVRWSQKAKNLDEALEKAGRLQASRKSRCSFGRVAVLSSRATPRELFSRGIRSHEEYRCEDSQPLGAYVRWRRACTSRPRFTQGRKPSTSCDQRTQNRYGPRGAKRVYESAHRVLWHGEKSSRPQSENRMANGGTRRFRYPHDGFVDSQKDRSSEKDVRSEAFRRTIRSIAGKETLLPSEIWKWRLMKALVFFPKNQ